MHTPTHALVNLALLDRRGRAVRSWVVALGALLPDLPAITFHLYYRLLRKLPEELVQARAAPWKLGTTVLHSFPVALTVLVLAALGRSPLGVALALTLLLHDALDFPVHHSDALRHFWPLSDYRFFSPISYWDHAHHARLVRPIELAVIVASSILVGRRHPSLWVRAGLVATGLMMAAVLLSGRPFWTL